MDYKRVFDIIFSSLILVIGAPIFLLIAFLIKLTSSGPVFYSGERIGYGGKMIRCYKFRSMRTNADRILNHLLCTNTHLNEEWQAYHKLRRDPRITRIGKFLRKTSLDELPQFWNVLKGDLSVVGPRPPLPEEVRSFFGERKEKLLSIRPGITGLWQTSGRSSLSFEERLALEESYVEKQSFLLDLRLICKTIPVVLFCKGAY